MLKKNSKYMLEIEGYGIIKEIGSGSQGTVYLAEDTSMGQQQYAIKVISKQALQENQYLQYYFIQEISNMQQLDHPNIVKFYQFFEYQEYVYLVFEYCNKGDLFDFITNNMDLQESEIVFYFTQIISGFKHLRERRIMHRDFKLENVVLHNNTAKICDFGFSKQQGLKSYTESTLGTKTTMAPEVLSKRAYDSRADIWSLGIVLYQMLTRRTPYDNYSHLPLQEISEQIKNNSPPTALLQILLDKGVSEVVIDFINRTLVFDPNQRLGWSQVFNHPINDYNKNQNMSFQQISDLFNNILNKPSLANPFLRNWEIVQNNGLEITHKSILGEPLLKHDTQIFERHAPVHKELQKLNDPKMQQKLGEEALIQKSIDLITIAYQTETARCVLLKVVSDQALFYLTQHKEYYDYCLIMAFFNYVAFMENMLFLKKSLAQQIDIFGISNSCQNFILKEFYGHQITSDFKDYYKQQIDKHKPILGQMNSYFVDAGKRQDSEFSFLKKQGMQELINFQTSQKKFQPSFYQMVVCSYFVQLYKEFMDDNNYELKTQLKDLLHLVQVSKLMIIEARPRKFKQLDALGNDIYKTKEFEASLQQMNKAMVTEYLNEVYSYLMGHFDELFVKISQ